MPIDTITFNGEHYPKLQASGFAARFAFPFATEVLSGCNVVFDIGCNRKEWSYPGSITVDPVIDPTFDAYNLPPLNPDGIFSSHCLEHLPDWVKALEYWHSKLQPGGVLFMYLPHMGIQEYWQPWHNRKHLHYIDPSIMRKYFEANVAKWAKIIVTDGGDVNASFYVIAEKAYNVLLPKQNT